MKYAEIDMSEYPLIFSKTVAPMATMQDVDDFFTEVDQKLGATTGEYVFISYSDAAAKNPSYEVSNYLAKKSTEITDKYASRNKGNILVVNSLGMKIAIKSLSVVMKSLKDSVVVSSVEEARVKGKEMLNIK
jgi:hypothetical protein